MSMCDSIVTVQTTQRNVAHARIYVHVIASRIRVHALIGCMFIPVSE